MSLQPIFRIAVWFLIAVPAFVEAKRPAEPSLLVSLSRLFAAASLCSFAISIFLGNLSTRQEKDFDSIGNVYGLHHQVGVFAWIAAFLHLSCIALPVLTGDFKSLSDFLLNWHIPLVLSGWIAFLFLSLTLGFSFASKLPRSLWKALHRVSWLGFVAGIYHFQISRKSEILSLNHVLIFLLCLLAVSSILIRFRGPSEGV